MSNLRNGMWVASGAGVGIYVQELVAVKADGSRRLVSSQDRLAEGEHKEREGWVHLVNKDGTTYAQLPAASAGLIVQAALEDIPESRRAHLDAEALGKLGYQ